MIKDRNGKDLIEEGEVNKSGKNMQNYIKKGLNYPDNHDDVATYLEPDIWTVKSSGP